MSIDPWGSVAQPITLPSGKEVQLAPVRIQALIRAGVFKGAVLEALAGESDDMTATMEAMALIACHALVKPKVVMDAKKADPDKGIYCVDALPDDDLADIFNRAQGRADVEAFRPDGASDADGEDGEVLGDDA